MKVLTLKISDVVFNKLKRRVTTAYLCHREHMDPMIKLVGMMLHAIENGKVELLLPVPEGETDEDASDQQG